MFLYWLNLSIYLLRKKSINNVKESSINHSHMPTNDLSFQIR